MSRKNAPKPKIFSVEGYDEERQGVVSTSPQETFSEESDKLSSDTDDENQLKDGTTLTQEQQEALELLNSGHNVFVTGGAGSGKSFLIKHFIKDLDPKVFPVLASTGAAAVLVGGRTFHSFFGLGIMEGGLEKSYERVSKDGPTLNRLKKVQGVVIDEISMISGEAFVVAERVARYARGLDIPWGGMRVIVVGDFAQLPPVTQSRNKDWCFLTQAWDETNFQIAYLKLNKRVEDHDFLQILQYVRSGIVNQKVFEFLNRYIKPHDENDFGTRLFPRRQQAEEYNQKKLKEIDQELIEIPSIYFGNEKAIETLKKQAPLPETLYIKKSARVMLVQNDPKKRFVNGSQGVIKEIEIAKLVIKLDSGKKVSIEKHLLAMQDAEGNVIASVLNFPVVLAYASTIHKSQGATLDRIWVDLKALWEPGQAYVALSRLKSSQGLNLINWSPRSVIIDPDVKNFYVQLNLEQRKNSDTIRSDYES